MPTAAAVLLSAACPQWRPLQGLPAATPRRRSVVTAVRSNTVGLDIDRFIAFVRGLVGGSRGYDGSGSLALVTAASTCIGVELGGDDPPPGRGLHRLAQLLGSGKIPCPRPVGRFRPSTRYPY